MSIQDYLGRIKPKSSLPDVETVSFDDEGNILTRSIFKQIFIPIVVLLMFSLAFGLGRLSKETQTNKIKLEYDPTLTGAVINSTQTSIDQTRKSPNTLPSTSKSSVDSQTVVASVKGSKYHYLYCPGAKQISEANKISFKNAAAAEAAGYTLALNCKPR